MKKTIGFKMIIIVLATMQLIFGILPTNIFAGEAEKIIEILKNLDLNEPDSYSERI